MRNQVRNCGEFCPNLPAYAPWLALLFSAVALGCEKPATPAVAAATASQNSQLATTRQLAAPVEARNESSADRPAATVEASAAAAAPAETVARPSTSVAPAAASVAPAAVTIPNIKIVSYGMHVGGGPFDEATKIPFKRAVEPHYDRLKPCFLQLGKPQIAHAGVDLLIPAAGGKAAVSRPRSSVKEAAFESCVVGFFETIEFEKPKVGPVGVSYSVQFVPK